MNFGEFVLNSMPDLETVRRGVMTIPGHDTPKHASDISDKIRRGIAQVREFRVDGVPVMHAVTEIFDGVFYVLATYAIAESGKNVGFEINVYPHLETVARASGCAEISFHTRRPGRIRQALKNGYFVDMAILSKRLT